MTIIKHLFLLLIPLLTASACQQDDTENAPLPLAAKAAPPNVCCSGLLIGFFELEDCIVYLPGAAPSGCHSGPLQVDVSFQDNTAVFTSESHQFCTMPTKLYTCGQGFACSSDCKTPAYACGAEVTGQSVSLSGNQLTLELDETFLNCAVQANSEGFWFALPTQ